MPNFKYLRKEPNGHGGFRYIYADATGGTGKYGNRRTTVSTARNIGIQNRGLHNQSMIGGSHSNTSVANKNRIAGTRIKRGQSALQSHANEQKRTIAASKAKGIAASSKYKGKTAVGMQNASKIGGSHTTTSTSAQAKIRSGNNAAKNAMIRQRKEQSARSYANNAEKYKSGTGVKKRSTKPTSYAGNGTSQSIQQRSTNMTKNSMNSQKKQQRIQSASSNATKNSNKIQGTHSTTSSRNYASYKANSEAYKSGTTATKKKSVKNTLKNKVKSGWSKLKKLFGR